MPNNYNTNQNNGNGNNFYPNNGTAPVQNQNGYYQPNNGGGFQNQAPMSGQNGYNQGGYPNQFAAQNQQNVNQNMYRPQQNNRILIRNLQPGVKLVVTGTTNFCRLSSAIEGEELARHNERKRAKNQATTTSPYINFTLENPAVHQNTVDPMARQYLETHFYQSGDGSVKYQQQFTVSTHPENRRYPSYICVNPETMKATCGWFQLQDGQELAKGLNVMVEMETYKAGSNVGLRCNAVFIFGEVKLFERGNIHPDLSAYGITMDPSVATAPVPNGNPVFNNVPYTAEDVSQTDMGMYDDSFDQYDQDYGYNDQNY